MITSPTNNIEVKGADVITIDHFTRLLITSNEAWIVPAAFEERRFAVLDVATGNIQDQRFFGEMDRQLEESRGYGRLLHDLLAFDLSGIDLRKIPRTGALLEQKLLSMKPEEQWWFAVLQRGYIAGALTPWESRISKETVSDGFIDYAQRHGWPRRASETTLWGFIRDVAPPVWEGGRPRCVMFPPLAACREHFAQKLGHKIRWEGPGGW